jgi:hypothetical protein
MRKRSVKSLSVIENKRENSKINRLNKTYFNTTQHHNTVHHTLRVIRDRKKKGDYLLDNMD